MFYVISSSQETLAGIVEFTQELSKALPGPERDEILDGITALVGTATQEQIEVVCNHRNHSIHPVSRHCCHGFRVRASHVLNC